MIDRLKAMHGGQSRVMRGLVLVVSLSISSVLLPTAINIGTGGTPPAALAPYTSWSWPAIGLLWALALGAAAWEMFSRRRTMVTSHPVNHPRNRPNALDRVEHHVRQRIDQSLAVKARIELELASRPDVTRPNELTVQPVGHQPYSMPPDASIDAVFNQLQDSMLILGAPGAGKTTLLMELANSLIVAARKDPERPIPVVLDLARWSESGRRRSKRVGDSDQESKPENFTEWLTRELLNRYTIPPGVTGTWLAEGKLALLFDGLDEVADKDRERCVDELNDIQNQPVPPQMAVCSREADYARLTSRLRLQGAICIQPLSRDQVLAYFADGGMQLNGVRTALQRDPELWEILDSPLMLSIMALAFQEQRFTVSGNVTKERKELFDAYVCEVLARRSKRSSAYSPSETVRTLWFLAQQAGVWSGDERLTQRIPYPYQRPLDTDQLVHSTFRPAMLAGLLAGAVTPLALQFGIAAGVLAAIAGMGLIWSSPVKPKARKDGPVVEFPASLRCPLSVTALAIGILLGSAVSGLGLLAGAEITLWAPILATLIMSMLIPWGPITRPPYRSLIRFATALAILWIGPTDELVTGGVVGILSGTLWADENRRVEKEDGEAPFASRYASWVLAAFAAAICASAMLGAVWSGPAWQLAVGLTLGFSAVRLTARLEIILGGHELDLSAIYDTLCLSTSGYLPILRRRFLQHAADHSLLSRSGSEYRFVHMLIRDHLAECDPDALGAKAESRKIQTERNSRATASHPTP